MRIEGLGSEWISFVGILSAEECRRIIELGRLGVESAPGMAGIPAKGARRHGRMWRIPAHMADPWLVKTIMAIAENANDLYFMYKTSGINRDVEYFEYESGLGEFGWHNDYGLERPVSTRKLTVSVQLSDEDEYRGGELQLFGPETAVMSRTIGTVTVFSSIMYHRVTPVTAGQRKTLLLWVAGPALC